MSSFGKDLRRLFTKGYIIIAIIGLLFYIIDEISYTPLPTPEKHWINKDDSKHPQDISNLDYTNKTIKYRDYTPQAPRENLVQIESDDNIEIDIEQLIDLYID